MCTKHRHSKRDHAIRLVAVLYASLLVLGCAAKRPQVWPEYSSPAYWPTDGWRTSTPERQGVDSAVLVKLLEHIRDDQVNIHSLLIVRNGYIVLDVNFYPYDGKSLHDIASDTKSVTSTLVGMAIDKGIIESADQPVLGYFQEREVANRDSAKEQMSVKDLLTMTAGLDCGNRPHEATLFEMMQSPDWVQFSLDLPMKTRPGREFDYCSSGTHLLSAILTRQAGMSALEFARKNLFEPLGVSEVSWPVDPQGINHGWGDLRMHPGDMARFGFLFLNRGRWEDRQLVSWEWVHTATRSRVEVSKGEGYGYGWWVFTEDLHGLFEARGRGGQYISVWPNMRVVVVMTGGGYDRTALAPILLSAVKANRSLPENPGAYGKLQERIRTAALPPEPKQIPPLPETAWRISGKRYDMDENMLGIKSMALSFYKPGEPVFSLTLKDGISLEEGTFPMPVGLDGVYRFSRVTPSGLPAGLRGSWKSDTEFLLDYNEVARINRFRILMTFQGDEVVVHLQDSTGYFDETVQGKSEEGISGGLGRGEEA